MISERAMTFEYAARQLGAVWDMTFGGRRWMDAFDRSLDGVFRSFWGPALAAPFVLLAHVSLRRAVERFPETRSEPLFEAPIAQGAAVQILAFGADWGAALLALVLMLRALGAQKNAATAIAGYNWLQVHTAAIQAVPAAAAPFSREAAALLLLPAFGIVIAIYWGVLRRSLELNWATTVGIILVLTFVGLLAQSAVIWLGLALLQTS
jgi:hypothetical protein